MFSQFSLRNGTVACGVVVANAEANLMGLPDSITILRVHQPPPAVSVFRDESPEDARRDAVWTDKGLKIAAGAIWAKEKGAEYIMIVDADDLVNKDIPDFVARTGGPGWFIRAGMILPVGSRLGAVVHDFQNWCGSSVIVRVDLLGLGTTPQSMDPHIVKYWLGHHKVMIPELKAAGRALEPLPFLGAIYRTGHGEGNFQRSGLRKVLLSLSHLRKSPKRYLRRLLNMRIFGKRSRALFLGGRQPE